MFEKDNLKIMKATDIYGQIVGWSVWGWVNPKEEEGDDDDDADGKQKDASSVEISFLSASPSLSATPIPSDPPGSLLATFLTAENQFYHDWFRNHGPIMILGLLCVSPKYQGHGIGEQFLDICTKEADSRGLMLTLTGTPVAWRVYEQFGWHVVGEQRMDLSEWFTGKGLKRKEGGDQVSRDMGYGIYVWRRMIRLPKSG